MLISCLSDTKVLFYTKIYEMQPVKLYILQNVIEMKAITLRSTLLVLVTLLFIKLN